MKSAIEIANTAELLPITEVAAAAGILPDELVPFGRDRGKVKLSILDRLASRPDGKLVIVTAMTPTKAHRLLAAALDASIYSGNPLKIDPVSVTWPRTVDMNDRELRYSVIGLGGKAHGIPHQNEFVITAASEVMAVFALANQTGAAPRARHRAPGGCIAWPTPWKQRCHARPPPRPPTLTRRRAVDCRDAGTNLVTGP